jgi:predicted metal-dependent HD superfamily phosphohydrolase
MVKTPVVGSLQERFGALWNRCAVPGVASSHTLAYEQLCEAYSEPHRHYHGWRHVTHCLEQFDLAASLMQDPNAVEMALWFHDAVFQPGARENERQSADLFVLRASGQFSDVLVGKVRDFILWTTHVEPPRNRDGCFVVDIDLSGLGSSWEKFLRDSKRIRKESKDVPDQIFCSAQVRFLQSLLERQRIFYSDVFHRGCEQRARRNIARLIARLQG